MLLTNAQKEVDDYTSQFKEGYWPALSNLARLMEEVGKLARELNHLYGNKTKKANEIAKKNLSEEIEDIFFILHTFQKVKLRSAKKFVTATRNLKIKIPLVYYYLYCQLRKYKS